MGKIQLRSGAKKVPSKVKRPRKPKTETKRVQYILPNLTSAEEKLCATGEWPTAVKQYARRNPTILPHRCYVRIAEYYRSYLWAVNVAMKAAQGK